MVGNLKLIFEMKIENYGFDFTNFYPAFRL